MEEECRFFHIYSRNINLQKAPSCPVLSFLTLVLIPATCITFQTENPSPSVCCSRNFIPSRGTAITFSLVNLDSLQLQHVVLTQFRKLLQNIWTRLNALHYVMNEHNSYCWWYIMCIFCCVVLEHATNGEDPNCATCPIIRFLLGSQKRYTGKSSFPDLATNLWNWTIICLSLLILRLTIFS